MTPFLVFLLLSLFLPPHQDGDVIQVTVGNGRQALAGVVVAFFSEEGAIGAECVTDAEGVCDLHFDAPAGFIRGRLVIGEYGRRSVLWPGGWLAVAVDVNELGFDHPPAVFDAPLTVATATRAATPTAVGATPTAVGATPTAVGATPTAAVTPIAEPGPGAGWEWIGILVIVGTVFLLSGFLIFIVGQGEEK